MTRITMRQVRQGEVPPDGGTAIQQDADRPVWSGNGPDDYVCVKCGNLLAAGVGPFYIPKKVRGRCARCRTVNVAITDESPLGNAPAAPRCHPPTPPRSASA